MPIRPSETEAVPTGLSGDMLGVDGASEDEVIAAACSDDDHAEDATSKGGSIDKKDKEVVIEQTYDPPSSPSVAGEARLPRALRKPKELSKKEIQEHRVLHLPYRSCCKQCLYGKGNHDHHRAGGEEDRLDKEIPTVSMDYAFLGDDTVKAEEKPNLVSYDNATDTIHANATKKKGITGWIAKAIGMDLESIGYKGVRICLKSDQEEAIVSVKKAIADWRESPTSMIEAPARESQSNGKMEKAVQKWSGQLRTLKSALEDTIEGKISVKSKAYEWLCMWAATTLNRYHVGVDGKTAFARVTGNQCRRPTAEFGEQVHWKASVKRHINKADSLWSEGTFLGLRERTGEVFVADSRGRIRKCRTIRARPEAERWSRDRVMSIRDSVAKVAYKYGTDCSEDESEDMEDLENQHTSEDAVADIFGDFEDDTRQDRDLAGDEPEPNRDDEMSIPSADLPDEEKDPEYMNLINDIKDLEATLSIERRNENQKIVMMIAAGTDVTEAFSPPRVAEAAKEMGLVPGESMDLKSGWDFGKTADRKKAIQYIRDSKPFLIIGSPPCTLFSVIQGLNLYKNGTEWRQEFEIKKKQAVRHIELCAAL